MKRCASCRQADPAYIWQPFGPADNYMLFVRPGYHARGFAAIPLCDACKTRLETNDAEGHPHPIRFVYRKQGYSGTRYLIDVNPYGPEDDAELLAAMASHNRVLEEMKAAVAQFAVREMGGPAAPLDDPPPKCPCACHDYPGIYPTSPPYPCWVCGHANGGTDG